MIIIINYSWFNFVLTATDLLWVSLKHFNSKFEMFINWFIGRIKSYILAVISIFRRALCCFSRQRRSSDCQDVLQAVNVVHQRTTTRNEVNLLSFTGNYFTSWFFHVSEGPGLELVGRFSAHCRGAHRGVPSEVGPEKRSSTTSWSGTRFFRGIFLILRDFKVW